MRTGLYHKTKVVNALDTTAISTDTATNGETIDLAQTANGDWRTALFVIRAGTITDGTYTLSVEDSANGSDWAAAAADAVLGPSAVISATDAVEEVEYVGNRRYCRVVVTSADTTSGGSVAGTAVLHGSAAHRR